MVVTGSSKPSKPSKPAPTVSIPEEEDEEEEEEEELDFGIESKHRHFSLFISLGLKMFSLPFSLFSPSVSSNFILPRPCS